MRILCTGSGGYLGSTLCAYLLEAGHSVTALDTFRHGGLSLAKYCANPRFEPLKGDCRDNRLMNPLVNKADVILPLAAIVGMSACDADVVAAEGTNFGAVQSICDMASTDQAIIIPTTNSGYGRGEPDKECTEDSPLKPISLYGITKVEAEAVVMERENSISLRLATVFGASPRMRVDLLVNDLVHRAVHDRSVVIFEGSFRRNFIHVRDVATAFVHSLMRFDSMRGKIYNVGDSRANMTKLQLCDKIAQHVPFTFLEAPIGKDIDQRNYTVSNQRIENTGWMPSHTLDQGIIELRKLYQMLKDRQHGNA